MKRVYKVLLWIVGILIGLFILILLIVSPIARYVVESKSEAWIGRTIEVDKLGVNLLNGRITIRDLTLFEADQDTVFFHVNQILADVDLWKLWQGIYHVEQLHVSEPSVRIIQKGDSLNFSDLVIRFQADPGVKPADTIPKKPVKYILEDLSINGGNIRYISHDFGADIEVEKMNLKIPAIAWDDPELNLGYSLNLASGGEMEGSYHMNLKSLEYNQQIEVDSLNIGFLLPYIQPYLKIKQVEGISSVRMTTSGNVNDPYRTAMNGQVDIRHFNIMGTKEQKEVSFNHLAVAFDSTNTIKGFIQLGNVLLDGLYLKEERFDSTDSFKRLIRRQFDGKTPDGKAPDSAFIIASKSNPVYLLADYIREMQKVVVIDSFSIKKVAISNGSMDFTDFTLLKPANLHISQLALLIHDINSTNCNATGTFHTKVESTGQIDIEFSLCPYKPYNFEATYQLKNVKVVHYNEYSIFYTDYPFKEGTLYYNGSISMKNKQMKMDNNIFIKKIYLGEKVDNDAGMHLPMKLILAIIRDKEGNVYLEMPISGDLKDPKVNYWNLIGQALKNFFRKIFSSPSRQLAKEYGEDEQVFEDICFNKGQTELDKKQKHQLDKLARVLTDKPQLVLDFQQLVCHDSVDIIPSDSVLHQTEKRNLLIKNYLSPLLNDPGMRIKFSVKNEPTRKARDDSPCYGLVYSVIH